MATYQIYRNGQKYGSEHSSKDFLEGMAFQLRIRYPFDAWVVRELGQEVGKVWIVEYGWDRDVYRKIFKTESEAIEYKEDLPDNWYKYMYKADDIYGYLNETK